MGLGWNLGWDPDDTHGVSKGTGSPHAGCANHPRVEHRSRMDPRRLPAAPLSAPGPR